MPDQLHVVPVTASAVAGLFQVTQAFRFADELDSFTQGYLDAASFEGDRLDDDQRDEAIRTCATFQGDFAGILEDCYAWTIRGMRYSASLAGRDFYYCRTVGRAGGWSRLEDAGEVLTEAALEWKL